MAVHFTTEKPKELLVAFDARIAQTEPKDKITTWKRIVSNDVAYYTHTSDNWRGKAYLLPVVENGQLAFNIIRPADQNISTTVYGYYHGHLTETFLNHFDNTFSMAVSTARPVAGDVVSG